jgi:predicted metal-dependent peptidase
VDTSFYSFIIAKMKIDFKPDFPTLGVRFVDTMYELTIGNYFVSLSLDEQIAVLIHETRHILSGHVFRKGERDHQLFNVASDIAINQTIKNIPDGAMLPETFGFPENKTAEQYYELVLEKQKEQIKEKEEAKKNGEKWEGPSDGSPDLTPCDPDIEDCKGGDSSGNGKASPLDNHDGWDSTDGQNEDLAKSVTEKMVKDAMDKSRGNLPGDIASILERWSTKPKVSWKQVLRRYMASKPGSKISTIKRRDRRFPRRMDLRGRKTHIDTRYIVAGIDTSGSMSNEEILNGLTEINEIAKLNNGDLKIIQVDTEIQGVQEFDPKKEFKRVGFGGTYMGVVPEYILKNNIQCDVLVMISDMFIEDVISDKNWNKFNKPVIWLNTSGTKFDVPRNHKIYDIHDA